MRIIIKAIVAFSILLMSMTAFAAEQINIIPPYNVAAYDTTIEKLVAGDSRSLSGRIKVPSNYSMYLRGWFASAINSTMDCRIRGTVFTDDRTVSPGFHFQQAAYLASGQNIDFPFEPDPVRMWKRWHASPSKHRLRWLMK